MVSKWHGELLSLPLSQGGASPLWEEVHEDLVDFVTSCSLVSHKSLLDRHPLHVAFCQYRAASGAVMSGLLDLVHREAGEAQCHLAPWAAKLRWCEGPGAPGGTGRTTAWRTDCLGEGRRDATNFIFGFVLG